MINVNNVSVFYGERALFDGVSFSIGERDRIGLVGRNGAGKSTMMKVIAGDITPNGGGNVTRPNDTTIGYLYQDMSIPKGKTVMQETLTALDEVRNLEKRIEEIEIELGERTDYESESYFDLIHQHGEALERFEILGGNTQQGEAERILRGLGFKTDDLIRLTDEFSGGWQMRVELAKMLLQRPTYLLLDEPTNHLDIESILWLENFLQDYPGAVVLISHDKQFLNNITKRTVEIELGKLHDYKAKYSEYIEQRAERRELLQNAFDNQQKLIAQRERTIARFMASATKTGMAQSMKKQLDKIDRIELDEEDVKAMNIKFQPAPRSGQVVVEAIEVTKSYGKLNVLNQVGLKLDRGDRIAFVGQNGQGKTTLAKILVGREPATKGQTILGHNVEVGYYAQNQAEEFFDKKMTLIETMEMHAPPEMRTRIRAILGAFMFTGEDQDKKVMVLSGGERARLAMACLLLKPFNLLLLDEPTNHLDMISKEVLKNALQMYDGTLIVVSHDREFLADLTNRTIEFRDGHLHEYLGDVNYFLNKRQLENMRDVEMSTKNTAPPVWNAQTSGGHANSGTKDIKKLEKAVQQAEKKVADLEIEKKQIEKQMEAPNFYDKPESNKVLEKYKTIQKALSEAEKNWEIAMEALDA